MIKGVIFDFNRTLYDPETNKLVEGALGLLERLKKRKYKLALISKKTAEEREDRIYQLGLDKYFQTIKLTESKSEDDFVDILASMSLCASEVAVVGDRVKLEIKIANRLGMRTIWYRKGKFANEVYEEEDERPYYTITKLEQVMSLI